MVEVNTEDLSAIGDKIRDCINLVRVKQKEEGEMAQKISDEAAEDLVKQLEELADLVGKAGGGVVESAKKEHEHSGI